MEPVRLPYREVATYDPARPSPYWVGCMAPGEFAVQFFDPKKNCVIGSDGKAISRDINDGVLIFPSQADADRYCETEVARRKTIGCLIHNDAGSMVRTVVHPQYAADLAQPPSRLGLLLKAALCLIAGGALTWWDWSRRWTIMIGVLLGFRLLIAAVVFLYRAIRPPKIER